MIDSAWYDQVLFLFYASKDVVRQFFGWHAFFFACVVWAVTPRMGCARWAWEDCCDVNILRREGDG